MRLFKWWRAKPEPKPTPAAPALGTDAAPSQDRRLVEGDQELAAPPVVAIKLAVISSLETSGAELRSILAGIQPSQLAGVSNRMRSSYRHGVRGFEELTPRSAQQLIDTTSDPTAVALALSMHRSGYVRESAVEHLVGSQERLVVPFMLLRCGEWIEAIRSSAVAVLDPWIRVEHVDTLARSFPLLAGARFAATRPAAQVAERIERVLHDPAAVPALLALVDAADPITSRVAVRILVADNPTIELLERALQTGDVVSIGQAARYLPTEGPTNHKAGELLVGHPTVRLRHEGVFRLLKHGGAGAEAVATKAMSDRSEAVRSTAQRWHRERDVSVVAFYRSLLNDDRLAGLLGLGDYASKTNEANKTNEADAAVARASLDAEPAVRRAALRLLARLGQDQDRDQFTQVLLTGPSRDRRQAMTWFRSSGQAELVVDECWPRSGVVETDTIYQLVARLAPMTSSWKQLELGLRAVNTDDDLVAQAGIDLLRRAANQTGRSWSRPDPATAALLRAEFEAARDRMNSVSRPTWKQPALVERLEFLLPSP